MNRSQNLLLGAVALLANPFSKFRQAAALTRSTAKYEPGRTIRTGMPPLRESYKQQRRAYYRRRTLNKAPRVCKGFVFEHRPMITQHGVPADIRQRGTDSFSFFNPLAGHPNKFWHSKALERVGLRKERHHLPGGRRETTVISFAQWELNRKHERELLAA